MGNGFTQPVTHGHGSIRFVDIVTLHPRRYLTRLQEGVTRRSSCEEIGLWRGWLSADSEDSSGDANTGRNPRCRLWIGEDELKVGGHLRRKYCANLLRKHAFARVALNISGGFCLH